MDDLLKKVQTHWDNNVCDYNRGANFDEIDKWRLFTYPYILKAVDYENDKNKSVLDVGVGSGGDACFSFTYGHPKKYTLFDISAESLNVSKKHLEEHHPGKNYEIVNGNAADMSCFKDAEFDRIRAVGTIHHMPEYPKVVKEIGRVLKPNGTFVFMFYNKNGLRPKCIYPIYAKLRKTTVKQLILEFDGATNPVTELLSKKDIISLCSDANLKCDKFKKYERYIGRLRWIPNFVGRFLGFSQFVYGHKPA